MRLVKASDLSMIKDGMRAIVGTMRVSCQADREAKRHDFPGRTSKSSWRANRPRLSRDIVAGCCVPPASDRLSPRVECDAAPIGDREHRSSKPKRGSRRRRNARARPPCPSFVWHGLATRTASPTMASRSTAPPRSVAGLTRTFGAELGRIRSDDQPIEAPQRASTGAR